MKRLPVLVVLMGIAALAMLVPMGHAVRISDFATARVFFYSALLFLVLAALAAIASVNYRPRPGGRSGLLALIGAFTLLPLMLAYPLWFLVPGAGYGLLYFEMVSDLTTTGAAFLDPSQLSAPVNLWRALVGWLGGFLTLVAAVAVLAPLNLGGFEVLARPQRPVGGEGFQPLRVGGTVERLFSHAAAVAPVYGGLTALVAAGLFLAGDRTLIAVIHALSTVATSGIDTGAGPGAAPAGRLGECLIFAGLFLAATRPTASAALAAVRWSAPRRILADHEFRAMLAIVFVVAIMLFLRHWAGAWSVERQEDLVAAWHALWGMLFTVLSFLTTTGFVSADWTGAQGWSGLEAPRVVLIGLATIGGGIATTAGGVKLLRIYALYRHGAREFRRLAFPSSVGGEGSGERRIRRDGAYLAWLFLTLFAITTALALLALTFGGLTFERAFVLAVSAMTTTGPLAPTLLGDPGAWGDLGATGQAVLVAAMVLGRLETLAIVAVLSLDFWRS